jgi:hypothetical protein
VTAMGQIGSAFWLWVFERPTLIFTKRIEVFDEVVRVKHLLLECMEFLKIF